MRLTPAKKTFFCKINMLSWYKILVENVSYTLDLYFNKFPNYAFSEKFGLNILIYWGYVEGLTLRFILGGSKICFTHINY